MKITTSFCFIYFFFFFNVHVVHAKCGAITIAEMTWGSAAVAAHVKNIFLAKVFNCNTDLVPGDTVPTVTSMTEKGQPDIAPEIWVNSARNVVNKAVSDGKLKIAGNILSDGAEEGWWIPKYLATARPNLTKLSEILKNPNLFPDKEEPGKGRFYTCPPGWACEIVNKNLYTAYRLKDAGFTIFNPGSGKGLAAAIARAYERREPIFTYYWAPTAILGKYPMVKITEMKHNPETWHCITKKDCQFPKKNMYPESKVVTLVTTDFASNNPGAFEFVNKFSWSNKVVNALLAWKEKERATAKETAEYFIVNYAEIWKNWIPAYTHFKLKPFVKNID